MLEDGPASTAFFACVPVKFAKAVVAVVAPVPPFATATVPEILLALTDDKADVTNAVVAN
jgi:hypothetical protein